MEEDIAIYLDDAQESMQKAVEQLGTQLSKIRAGKAMPSMLDGLKVDYYGSSTPINQVASISTPDARTLVVSPWEKNMISEIERSIINSDLGLNPQNDGDIIRLNIPALTEERRRDLVRQAKAEAENSKVRVRSIRKDSNDGLKDLQKDGASEDAIKTAEGKVQDLTNAFSKKIDDLFDAKEKDIMTV